VGVLKQAEVVVPVAELIPANGDHGANTVSPEEADQFKLLQEKNSRQKRLVAEL
jgi:hypothetical protein